MNDNILDLRQKIINKEYGVYYIYLNDKKLLNKQIDKFHEENLFEVNDISYCIYYHEDHISIILHRPVSFL